jgi:Protein of unknown function (DUF2892)
MTVDRWIHVFAGSMIVLALLLGFDGSPLFASRWWLALAAFVGLNLFQYGFTNFCPLGWFLRRMGVPEAKVARC